MNALRPRRRRSWLSRLDAAANDFPGWVTFAWYCALLLALVLITAANGSHL